MLNFTVPYHIGTIDPESRVDGFQVSTSRFTIRIQVSLTMQRRSRNGCIDCRKSKVKCDEIRPFCGTCTRRQHICQGYATPPPPAQKSSKTGKQDRRDSTARGRSQYATTTDSATEYEFRCREGQDHSSPSEHSSATASPPAEQVSSAQLVIARVDKPVTSSSSSSALSKAGRYLIRDPAHSLAIRALCLLPPGIVKPR